MVHTSRGLLQNQISCHWHPCARMKATLERIPLFAATSCATKRAKRKVWRCTVAGCKFCVVAEHQVTHSAREASFEAINPW